MQRVARRAAWQFLLLIAAMWPGLAFAQEPSQAGLVIQFDGDRVQSYCITFEGDEISGSDLLSRAGLDLIVDSSTGMGITVCQIADLGCAYPGEHCFCQCRGGGECAYWNYVYRDPGESRWVYSALGAVMRHVKPGSVEAWVWGDGHTPPSDSLTFEAICQPPAATPTPTPMPIALAPAAITSAPSQTPVPTEPPTASSPSTTSLSTPAAPPAPRRNAGQGPASYWLFGLTVLGLAAIGALVWRRRT